MAIPRDKVKRYRAVLQKEKCLWKIKSDADMTSSFRKSVTAAVAAAKKNGNPVAKYDAQNMQPYLEYSDGTRSYI